MSSCKRCFQFQHLYEFIVLYKDMTGPFSRLSFVWAVIPCSGYLKTRRKATSAFHGHGLDWMMDEIHGESVKTLSSPTGQQPSNPPARLSLNQILAHKRIPRNFSLSIFLALPDSIFQRLHPFFHPLPFRIIPHDVPRLAHLVFNG